jgi:5-methylcytosine-specific restriction endonuclease McrA
MTGRIQRLLIEREQMARADAVAPELVCPLCGRSIPESQKDAHHLVPKSKGGRATEFLHRICHRQVHALFSEGELARRYQTVDALLAHPEIQSFINWVKTKPDDFYERVSKSQRLRKK